MQKTEGVMGPAQSPSRRNELEINLLRTLHRIAQGLRRIAIVTLAGMVIGLVLALTLPKVYTAQAVFLPPVKEAVPGVGIGMLLSENASDLYLGMLGSRTVQDAVIDRVDLMRVYAARGAKTRTSTRKMLRAQSKFNVTQNELISVTITTEDPRLSAAIANAYLDALYQLKGEMASSAAVRRRAFIESQMDAEKESLTQAEAAMKTMQEQAGTVLPEGTAQAQLAATARLQTSLEEAQAQLSTLLTSETERNPQVVQLRARLATLQGQLSRRQTAGEQSAGTGLPSAARLPGMLLDYLRASRNLKDRETLYEGLRQQYEKAQLGAADPGPLLQVVDRAVVPEQKSGPSRILIFLAASLLGFAVGIISLFLPSAWRRAAQRYRSLADSDASAMTGGDVGK